MNCLLPSHPCLTRSCQAVCSVQLLISPLTSPPLPPPLLMLVTNKITQARFIVSRYIESDFSIVCTVNPNGNLCAFNLMQISVIYPFTDLIFWECGTVPASSLNLSIQSWQRNRGARVLKSVHNSVLKDVTNLKMRSILTLLKLHPLSWNHAKQMIAVWVSDKPELAAISPGYAGFHKEEFCWCDWSRAHIDLSHERENKVWLFGVSTSCS